LTCAEALELATTTTGTASASAPTAARSGLLRCHFLGSRPANFRSFIASVEKNRTWPPVRGGDR
jgi:hypothetical protein